MSAAPRHGPARPLRVLFVNENIGGHATLHLHLRRALDEPPLAGTVDARHHDVPPPRLLRRALGARLPGLARLDLDLQPLRAQLALSAHARPVLRRGAGSADVVHLYTQNAGLVSPDVLRAVPSVVSTDSTNQQNGYQLPYRDATRFTSLTVGLSRRLEERVFRAATLIAVHSEWAAASLREAYGVEPERIRVVPFGILAPRHAPRRPDPACPEITFVGSTMERKGGWRLLDVFERRLRGRARLNLVTREPVPRLPGVRVFDDVVPGDARLDDLLARTSVFVLPSRIDKYGFAVLEAMAAGVPAVVSRVGAMPELVEDGLSGYVVGDDDELGDALERLAGDPDLAARMGAAARQRVLERFDARVTTKQLVEVLREAAERHGG